MDCVFIERLTLQRSKSHVVLLKQHNVFLFFFICDIINWIKEKICNWFNKKQALFSWCYGWLWTCFCRLILIRLKYLIFVNQIKIFDLRLSLKNCSFAVTRPTMIKTYRVKKNWVGKYGNDNQNFYFFQILPTADSVYQNLPTHKNFLQINSYLSFPIQVFPIFTKYSKLHPPHTSYNRLFWKYGASRRFRLDTIKVLNTG